MRGDDGADDGARGEHFERAIVLDPQFALAHAEFAHLYYQLGIYGVMAPLEALPLMREQTRRALEIDPSCPRDTRC